MLIKLEFFFYKNKALTLTTVCFALNVDPSAVCQNETSAQFFSEEIAVKVDRRGKKRINCI